MDNKVNFLRGTSAEYEASTKDNDTFYYTTDDEKLYLGNKEITGSGVTVDDTLSDTSKNPVQNKVINAALNTKANLSDIPTTLPANGGNADTLDGLHANEIASNPNLLINPDFKINQRGLTEYKGHSGYTVDMWKTANEETEVTLTDNGLKVKRSIPISRAQVYQNIENFADFRGKTCTISANISELTAIAATLMVIATSPNNTVHIVKDITSIGTISETFQVPNDITAMSIYLTGENGIEEADLNNYTIFQWVKLELGSIATPFCPPNHATELLKIQAIDGTIPADTLDGKHASDFALKTDIPTTLPANGGNADTLDGLHETSFSCNRDNISDCNNAVLPGTYNALPGTGNTPYSDYWLVTVDIGASGTWIRQTATHCNTTVPTETYHRLFINDAWNSWTKINGNADIARKVETTNQKALLWEDNEGGNLKLVSPDGNHSVEMDLYNNEGFRMYFTDNGELTFPVDYNSTTKKFNINGNADTVDGKHASDFASVRKITTQAEVDGFLESGIYSVENVPTVFGSINSAYYMLIVNRHRIDMNYNVELAIPYIDGKQQGVYYRNCAKGTWGTWTNVADGGNAATVNGLTVQTAVPANAKFTDTTYGAASTSANGLMTTGAQTLAGNKTFNGQVIPAGASAVDTAQARKIYAGTSDMTAGTTALETGAIYLVYE